MVAKDESHLPGAPPEEFLFPTPPAVPAMCLTIVRSLGPPCGPVNCNEKIVSLLQRLKPEIKDVIEQLKLVSSHTATPRL